MGQIGRGVVVLVGVEQGDQLSDADWLAAKVTALRIFPDAEDRMNLDLAAVGGAVLAISQFTLLGDARKGRRPSFVLAADPEPGEQLYERFLQTLRQSGVPVATGIFRADMQVALVNDGPVTILLDSRGKF